MKDTAKNQALEVLEILCRVFPMLVDDSDDEIDASDLVDGLMYHLHSQKTLKRYLAKLPKRVESD